MSETEDRTQAPTNLRRQQARERGQVASSPELSAAAGLLAASLALWAWGDGLAESLLSLVRAPLTAGSVPVSVDAPEVISYVRQLAFELAWPLGRVLAAFALAAFAAHQAQTLGLWSVGLLAPDPSRLWSVGQGGNLGARASRGVWALAKTAVVVTVAARVVRADGIAFPHLNGLDTPALARAIGEALRDLLSTLAVARLALGLIDFGLQYRRFESMLRVSPEEQREDLRSMEGDPSLRTRRRRLAKLWRNDPAELLIGSSLLLTGPSGLTVVLAGGPPPRHVSVRSIVAGPSGDHLRKAATTTGLPIVSAPVLARRLSQRRPPSLPPSAPDRAELVKIWPSKRDFA